jgi:hypothetical protein
MPKNSLSKAPLLALVLGALSFIPVIGVLLGIGAILIGMSCLSKESEGRKFAMGAVILGVFGIFSTVLLYFMLFNWSLSSDESPYTELRVKLDKTIMTLAAETLDEYNNKYGRYPDNLRQTVEAGYIFTTSDSNSMPLCYRALGAGSSYELKSAGEDQLCYTVDDILYMK